MLNCESNKENLVQKRKDRGKRKTVKNLIENYNQWWGSVVVIKVVLIHYILKSMKKPENINIIISVFIFIIHLQDF